MYKVTIESEYTKSTIQSYDAEDINDLREVIRGAVIGVGFHPDTVKELFGENLEEE